MIIINFMKGEDQIKKMKALLILKGNVIFSKIKENANAINQ